MRKVRTIVNLALGSTIAALGLNSCAEPLVKYGTPADIYSDTTVHCMYGVTPIVPDSLNNTNEND